MVEKNSWHFSGSTAISVARFMVYGWCLWLRLHYLSKHETNTKFMLQKVLTANIMIAYQEVSVNLFFMTYLLYALTDQNNSDIDL